MDESRFDLPLLDATVLVTSGRADERSFGTGFIVGHDEGAALVLTCAHVVRDVTGDATGPVVVGRRPATLLAMGAPDALDLALLRVPGLPGGALPLLPTDQFSARGQLVRIVGFQSLGPAQRLQNPRLARLGNMAGISGAESGDRAWAWWLQMGDEGALEHGFSGAPVLDLACGYVTAVVSLRQGSTAGLAICVSEVPQLWPDAAARLFSAPRLAAPAPPAPAPEPELARRIEELDAATRAALPPALKPMVGAVADRVAEAIARALAQAQPTAHVPLPADQLALLDELAGRSVRASDTTLSFGAGSQFGDVSIGSAVGRDQISVSFYIQGAPPAHERVGGTQRRRTLEQPVRLYVGADADEGAEALVRRRLAARGMSVARAPIATRLTEASLRAELDDAAAAILWLTPAALLEPTLYATLQPALEKLRAAGADLPTMLVLDGIDDAQLRFRPAELGAALVRPAELASALFLRLGKVALGNGAGTGEAALHLAAHPEAALEPGGDLMLDWLQFFTPLPADSATWRETLMPALRDCKRALTASGVRAVAIRAEARLSVGLALGYVFRESARGFRLRVDQHGQWWSTDASVPAELPLSVAGERLGPGGPDLSVEVGSARWDAGPAVETWMGRNPGVIGRRWQCRVTSARLDAGQALGIARVVAAAIEAARRGPEPPGTIHLFGPMPLGLAALIGWHLNGCEPVQGYDAVNNNSDYEAACLLG